MAYEHVWKGPGHGILCHVKGNGLPLTWMSSVRKVEGKVI